MSERGAAPYPLRPDGSMGGMKRFGSGEKLKPASIYRMLASIYADAKLEWKSLLAAVLCLCAISLLQFAIPQLTRITIDSIIPDRAFDRLFFVCAGILGSAALLGIFGYASTSLIASAGQKVLYKLRNDLYRHIQSLDVSFFDRNRTGDLMSRVTSDVNILQQMISSSMMQLITDLFTFTAIALYMLWIDWRLTLLLLATFPFMLLTTRLFGKRMRSSFRAVQASVADVSDHLQNALTGIRLIKSFTAEAYEAKRFEDRTTANMDANIQVVRLRAAYEPIIDFLNFAGLAIVLVFGAWLAMTDQMTVGTIVAFIAYLRLLQNPIRHFSRIINTIQQAAAGYERIMEIMNTTAEVVEREDAILLPQGKGSIVFREVDFAYGEGARLFESFDLELEGGKITALVGSSGSGKSTIAHLIARFYDPQGGGITIDGYDLRSVTLQSLREQIGIVSQDIVLFNGSIMDNIRYGRMDASDEQVLAAAEAANASRFIEAFPEGFHTQIGERGVKLSGGQKQRLSIARAILKDPRIIILDEATASLDTESEQHIQDALSQLLQGRTCLVIAHRLSTIQQADRIYVLEQGNIVEHGTHEELIHLAGRYRQLYDLQFPQSEQTRLTASPRKREVKAL
ncbi:subfamily B ATP-binding cassette protein MsbA [Paenibacillus phyllosphaerae]|uniref:Subfamily B ATP-binding cassette protein MsbA n=1 Tax=Paenibacillus phyllosphaerae TaxID=274593 RepID=A0A7W5FNK1_9BACL|nr:ABC transporter ATP-binding protein [Paenibacillus phyllosphaerae]MBB3111431.1 subfamily B ATP-binding cassette protein MsbA [Paenibacillus phyllosphaerae]